MEPKKDTFNFVKAVQELREAAEPFMSEDIVTKTSGTEPLTERLEKAINAIDVLLENENTVGN